MARIELYRFASTARTWRYTSADRDIEAVGELFEFSHGLERGAIRSMGTIHKADLEIQVSRDNPLLGALVTGRLESLISVSIFEAHWPDPAPSLIWKGRVVSHTLRGSKAAITCEPIFTSLGRPGLRAMYQLSCRHGLYQPGCFVPADNFRVTGTLSVAGTNVLTIPEATAYSAGYFTAGYLVASGYYVMITAHNGNQVTTDRRIESPGTVWLYPGCDHTRTHCNDRFNNILNFGGFPWIPLRSPFNTDISFTPGPSGNPNLVF